MTRRVFFGTFYPVALHIHSKNQEVIAEALSAISTVNSTRAQILEAYLKIAVREGSTALSLTRLADELKISKQLVRYHLPDLDQAALELFQIIVENGSQYIKTKVDDSENYAAKLRNWCEANFDWFVAYPDFGKFMIFMYHRSTVDPEVRTLNEKIMSYAKVRLEKILEEASSKTIKKNSEIIARTLHHCITAAIIEMLTLDDIRNHQSYRKNIQRTLNYLLEA